MCSLFVLELFSAWQSWLFAFPVGLRVRRKLFGDLMLYPIAFLMSDYISINALDFIKILQLKHFYTRKTRIISLKKNYWAIFFFKKNL